MCVCVCGCGWVRGWQGGGGGGVREGGRASAPMLASVRVCPSSVLFPLRELVSTLLLPH